MMSLDRIWGEIFLESSFTNNNVEAILEDLKYLDSADFFKKY